MLDTYWALILPYFAFEFSIAVFLLYAFMGALPKEMEEAATIDGSGYWGIFSASCFRSRCLRCRRLPLLRS